MSEKYGYLKSQWDKYFTEINSDLKKENDISFQSFSKKIKDSKLTLEEYTNRKNHNEVQEDYLCTFIENSSSKIYGSASAGNAKYFGIKFNDDNETYYISRVINGDEEQLKATKEEAIIKFEKFILPELREICAELTDNNKDEIFKKVENENKISSKVMLRKIVAINNPGKFLYIYSDDAINTIYSFFIENEENKTNIEKNYLLTSNLKDIFQKKDNEDDNFYLIRLSRFIWSIFGSTINLESKNMILHGAPGTGKSYTIKNTVKNIILKQGGNIDEQLVFTQFHPSYSYEDFIDGIKPSGIDEKTGQLQFELKNGNFKELCRIAVQKLLEERKAKKKDEELTKFFFVADEINRAELSRVFGELLICLEDDYRIDFDNKGNIKKEESLITLQNASLDKNPVYKKGDKNYFGVPVNIYFLGTMNDIDRSVDSFDMALRRRFFWKEIRCNYDYIDSLFDNKGYRNICEELNEYITGYSKEKLNGNFTKVDKIKEKETLKLGTSYELGHAYFKNIKAVNNSEIEKLWNSKISPLLKEYLRAEYSQDEIINKLKEAKEIFTLPKENKSDTNS
ncbi:McrB family protein [Aliarcobacter cryaerophilus]|uniref:McrB family protein n=1 Tax=Aliarcobacter cryaerophilus TaxID=28198 RepID=UPI0021B35226|nr:AAA family ATPase [Aliarcobacter cryaerophilus]MCT7500069.1 AAA family ATPase [Aliarcobacter cryaerophilus]MCT7506515.1 AAA family ATPase [Aliarcobacter cryaerophilus]MCT7544319.1 AAA family ATPase [Aliarcobacter cryaerophilus]